MFGLEARVSWILKSWLKTVRIVILMGSFSPVALAGVFAVSPVRIEVSASRPNSVMQVQNLSDEPVTIQVHAVTWDFKGDEDQYEETGAVLLNPPIFSLEPHQKQFLRLGLRSANIAAVERSYRVILEQVPEPPRSG